MEHTLQHQALNRAPTPPIQKAPKNFKATFVNASVADLEALTPEWRVLADREPHWEPFFQPYWFRAFAKAFCKNQKFPLIVVREESKLRGVLPLMRHSRFLSKVPGKSWRSLSGIHSCRYDFICTKEDQDAIANAAWQCLKQQRGWTVVEALNVPCDGAFQAIMRHAHDDGYLTATWPTLLSPYVNLPARGSDPFQNCPRKYKQDRKRLERFERKLKERGNIELEVSTDFSEELFQNFIKLERSGWKGKHGGAIGCSLNVTEFYREALSHASAVGHLRLCALKVQRETIAMEMAFMMDSRCYSPKIAYNESFAKFAPGHLLTTRTIPDLVQRGILKYDLLGARARHKSLWAGEIRPHAHCYIFRPCLRGRSYHFITTQVAPRLKKLKHARYGDPQASGEVKETAV